MMLLSHKRSQLNQQYNELITGVKNMELRTVSQKTITGFTARTNNESEMGEQGKIPALWHFFDQNIPVDYQNGERVYGVYFDYESDHTGMFTVLAGFDGKSFPKDKEVKQVNILEGRYLVFSKQGAMPQIAIDAWTQVWEYFAQSSVEYQRLYTTDFEYYPSADEIEVHIAVR